MITIIVLSLIFLVLTLVGVSIQRTYKRRVHLGQIKALFDVATSLVAFALILSVFSYIGLVIISLK
jgi:hypothetical protein